MGVKRTYRTNEELIKELKTSQETMTSDAKKAINSYENMCVVYALMGGACGIEFISLLKSGYGLTVLSGAGKIAIMIVLTITILGLSARYIFGRRYYNYLKENNIQIQDDDSDLPKLRKKQKK